LAAVLTFTHHEYNFSNILIAISANHHIVRGEFTQGGFQGFVNDIQVDASCGIARDDHRYT